MQLIHQSPRDPNFYRNPFKFYSILREKGKIVWWVDYGMPVCSDYSLVNKILRDKRFTREPPAGFFSGKSKFLRPFYENESRSMLEREPPYHTKLKSAVMPFFTKKKLKEVEYDIRNVCAQLLESIPPGDFNLIETFSKKFPVIVICRLLGVPEKMSTQLILWSNDMVAMYQARRDRTVEQKAVSATLNFTHYLKEMIKKRRFVSGNNLLSYLISKKTRTESLKIDELISTIILLLNAGHEATVHTISNGIKDMIQSNFELTKLIDEPINLTSEILRFSTPLHMFTRYCSDNIELGELSLKQGDKIGLLLAAANRDPKHFFCPEKFDPFISRKAYVSLGAGLHFCLGAHLAKLELQIAIPELVKKFPSMSLSKDPQYEDNYHFYGLKELILKN